MGFVQKLLQKGAAVLRRGPSVARNILYARLQIWPVKRLGDHWLLDIPVYCISLATASARRRIIDRQIIESGIRQFQFIDAVQAADLSYEQLARDSQYDSSRAIRAHGRDLRLSEIACSLSHVEACRRVAEGDAEWALILEDDALFHSRRLNALAWSDIPATTDIAYFSAFLKHRPPRTPIKGMVYGSESYAGSSAAYMIRRSAAARVVGIATPVVHAADGLLGRINASSQNSSTEPQLPQLEAVIVYPEPIHNGSVEYYHMTTLGS